MSEERLLVRQVTKVLVLVDESNVVGSAKLLNKRIEFGNYLLAGFQSWATSKSHNDVAELALKRTTSRNLHAAEHVAFHLQQIEPGRRHCRHVGLVGLFVTVLMVFLLSL